MSSSGSPNLNKETGGSAITHSLFHPHNLLIKASYDDHIKRFPILLNAHTDLTYNELLVMMRRVFKLENEASFVMKYQDSDGDWIDLDDDNDINMATIQTSTLRIEVQKEKSKTKGDVAATSASNEVSALTPGVSSDGSSEDNVAQIRAELLKIQTITAGLLKKLQSSLPFVSTKSYKPLSTAELESLLERQELNELAALKESKQATANSKAQTPQAPSQLSSQTLASGSVAQAPQAPQTQTQTHAPPPPPPSSAQPAAVRPPPPPPTMATHFTAPNQPPTTQSLPQAQQYAPQHPSHPPHGSSGQPSYYGMSNPTQGPPQSQAHSHGHAPGQPQGSPYYPPQGAQHPPPPHTPPPQGYHQPGPSQPRPAPPTTSQMQAGYGFYPPPQQQQQHQQHQQQPPQPQNAPYYPPPPPQRQG